MSNALFIQEFDCIDKLSEQCTSDLGWEPSFLGNEIKELTFCVFEDDHGSFFNWIRVEFDRRVEVRVDNTDKVLEFEFLEKFYLSFEAFFLVKAGAVDLKGIKLVSFTSKIDTRNKKQSYLACPP